MNLILLLHFGGFLKVANNFQLFGKDTLQITNFLVFILMALYTYINPLKPSGNYMSHLP
jgi:hypothetical protein